MAKRTILTIVAGVILILILLLTVEFVPSEALTRGRMISIKNRVNEYYQTHEKLPLSLDELPVPDDKKDYSINDGWGNKIIYIVNGNRVTLISHGNSGMDMKYEFAVFLHKAPQILWAVDDKTK